MESADPKSFIEKEVSQQTIVVFSKTYCGYCHRTKHALTKIISSSSSSNNNNNNNIDMVVHELDQMPNGSQVQQTLSGMTGSRTVPQVFIKGQYVGGNDDTQQKIADGTLLTMLTSQA
mmetsp:Transcript_34730/g.83907  ORF Transcript_34730/g.83907 Transcript_34730/m.83907 type:complete len:118 (-) Transcript_34730:161-514(-)|eukprot:CAMPEP_0113462482 /NCGR_PEP_ID=MMETSP0014_2-20120614/12117_1 /TAXON_ID=2857 /ORGANISM="Nitzschia sp." /LENGTH=117 /DNA_ID=CAMNT_0000354351 /DNA_START=135 /DNA_END=488 /DNA_ORIENTATION=+ /assembly_acc=CAM_ASM_000159